MKRLGHNGGEFPHRVSESEALIQLARCFINELQIRNAFFDCS